MCGLRLPLVLFVFCSSCCWGYIVGVDWVYRVYLTIVSLATMSGRVDTSPLAVAVFIIIVPRAVHSLLHARGIV